MLGQSSSPNVGSGENQLRGVVALSPINAWAVGWSSVSGTYQTLVEHWDGATWTVVTSANAVPAETVLALRRVVVEDLQDIDPQGLLTLFRGRPRANSTTKAIYHLQLKCTPTR